MPRTIGALGAALFPDDAPESCCSRGSRADRGAFARSGRERVAAPSDTRPPLLSQRPGRLGVQQSGVQRNSLDRAEHPGRPPLRPSNDHLPVRLAGPRDALLRALRRHLPWRLPPACCSRMSGRSCQTIRTSRRRRTIRRTTATTTTMPSTGRRVQSDGTLRQPQRDNWRQEGVQRHWRMAAFDHRTGEIRVARRQRGRDRLDLPRRRPASDARAGTRGRSERPE